MSRSVFRISIIWAVFCLSTFALDRDRSITQFHHTAWTAKDGAPSQISALAQTEDGYLWIGSARGLFRFDGVQFELYQPPAGLTLPSYNIYALMATPDGGLWISFNPVGLAFLKGGRLRLFTKSEELPRSQVYCFARDTEGRIWAGTHTGLTLFDGSRWVNLPSKWNIANDRVWTMFVDRVGTLWVSAGNSLSFLRPGTKAFQNTGARLRGLPQIAQAKDGQLWMTEWFGPIRILPLPGDTSPAPKPQIGLNAIKFIFDRDGSMWMTVGANGIRRLRFPERLAQRKLVDGDRELEQFKSINGLTGDSGNNLLEDREGNIWVSSNKGLDRFRHSHLVPVVLPPSYREFTLRAGLRGDVWVGSNSGDPMLCIRGGDIRPKSPAMEVSSLYAASSDLAWWGCHRGVARQRGDQFTFFPQPANTPSDYVWEVIPDLLQGGLWVGLGDFGLIHFKDGLWANRPRPAGLPARVPSASYADPGGRIWVGYTNNRICSIDAERVRSYSEIDGLDVGRIRVIRGSSSLLWVGGELGLAIFRNQCFRRIAVAGEEPLGTVTGIVETPDGALWLNEVRGVIRISAKEVQAAIANPEHAVLFQRFDLSDGLAGAPQMNIRSSTAIMATDGRLWFANDAGLSWIDPAHIATNQVPPPVSIRSLTTDTRKYSAWEPLSLPQRTNTVRIEYTALSLAVPDRVRFRYRCQGAVDTWRDAGARREVTFTNLGPGPYRFQVIASNNDGVWNETGAALGFVIAPIFYQTALFRALCLSGGLLIAWLAYVHKLRRATAQIHARLGERLVERERIARELHDTLLQGFSGLVLRFEAVMKQMPLQDSARQMMQKALERADEVLLEGRMRVQDLRSEAPITELAELITQCGEDLFEQSSVCFKLTVIGTPQPLDPIILEESYLIAREALVNASRHSHATRVEAEISHDRVRFRLRVRDNGCGISQTASDRGRPRHWGLSGIRERAQNIGGQLSIWSKPGAGTEVELAIQAEIAYPSKFKKTWWRSLRRIPNLKSD